MKIQTVVQRIAILGLVVSGLLYAQNMVLVQGWNGSIPVKVLVNSAGQTITALPCSLSAVVTLTASGNTQIVPLSAGKQIQVCHISFSGSSVDNVKLVSGTGSNCATGSANLTGVYDSVQSIALDLAGTLTAPAGKALCVNLQSAQTFGGLITYAYK